MAGGLLLSQVVGRPLTGPGGDTVGRAADLVVRLTQASLPSVTGIVLQVGGRDTFVPQVDVSELGAAGVRLAADRVGTRAFERRPGEVLLVRDVRGRAVIDVRGARLVRVRDLELQGQGADWHVVSVVAAPVTSALGWLKRLFDREAPAEDVPWANVEPLFGHVPSAGRSLPLPRISRLRPADIADIVEQASHKEGQEILSAVHGDSELEADVFEELDDDHQLEFIKERSDPEVAEVLGNMAPDDAADLLMQLDQERRRPVLELLPPAEQRKVKILLGYSPDTAGGLMSTEFLVVQQDTTVADALARVKGMEEVADTLTDIFALDGERLCGSVSLVRLIRADPAARVADVMTHDPIAVFADADLPAVAVQMADYNLVVLAVIDTNEHIIGVVTYDDLIASVLRTEWKWRGRQAEARVGREREPSPTGT